MSTSLRSVVVIDGCRIPFQRANTAYKDQRSYDLARLALKGLLERTRIDPKTIDRVILGTVISNLATSNVAREASLGAGIPVGVPAYTVTQACISSNQAITNGFDLIRNGQADVVVAGGTESMSDVPIRIRRRLRDKLVESQRYKRWTDYFKLIKGLRPSDFLPEMPSVSEFSTGRTMGEDCDRLAARFGVTREEQDEYACRSHRLAHHAVEAGKLDGEVIPARVSPNFNPIERDNGVRADSSPEKLAQLKAAFVKPHGTVTAGNSSFLTDGAAAVLLMAEERAEELGLRPRTRILDYAYSGQDPKEELLLGPAYSTAILLDRTGTTFADIEVFEFHEAFAGQILANLKCLASPAFAKDRLRRSQAPGEIPMDRFNLWGGSLSLGHPFGATGARLVTTASNRLHDEDGQLALIAACAAGGLGNALLLERVN